MPNRASAGGRDVKTIGATWKNGQILPDEPVDWPEGCRLTVEPLKNAETIGLPEGSWSNSPAAIASWLAWYDALEPSEFTREEEADIAAWRQKLKEYSIANMGKGVDGLFE